MPKRTDRTQIALSVSMYAIAALCVCQIQPANPWTAAFQFGLVALFSSVCLYGFALLVHGSFSKRMVSVGSFSPRIDRTIHIVAALVCVLLMAYSLCMLLPVYTDHHSMIGWRRLVNLQTAVIEYVEGRNRAERFWNDCASHIALAGASFEREHDFERALDYYVEYKKLGDETDFSHYIEDDVLGRICDRMKDFKRADYHYSNFNRGVDENCKTDTAVSQAQLLRVFDFVPEEILFAEFTWAENVATARNASALELGQVYELIGFSDMDDFQRQLLRPAFHSEMLIKPECEGYAPELVSTPLSPKQAYVIPPERRLLYQLRFSPTPIVTGDQ